MAQGLDGYARLVQAAIEREMDVIGDERAVDVARSVAGLEVDDDGTVGALDRPGKAVLGDLVDAYIEDSGEVAAFLIARRIENVADGDVDLPENLASHI